MAEPSIDKAYSWAVETCNAPNVGYNQNYRNQRTINGITYYDCSSFIWYALIAGGFDCVGVYGSTWPFTTTYMPTVLPKLGFTQVTDGSIRPGDIGLSSSHTEMCYSGGTGSAVFMGAHTKNATLANQVCIGNSSGDATYARTFPTIWRYGEGASGGYGCSAYVVAAMCGNFWQESGINPGVWEGLSEGNWTDLLKGYGLGQWTNTGGDTQGRLYQVHKFLSENSYADDSGPGQLEFLIQENYWTPVSPYSSDFPSLQDFLKSTSTDLEYLTHAWNRCWEGIHDSSWDARVTYAQECYDYIVTNANNDDINTWVTGNFYSTTVERLNNAVLIYRYLSAGGGGGGPAGKTKKKLPIWMWIRYRK